MISDININDGKSANDWGRRKFFHSKYNQIWVKREKSGEEGERSKVTCQGQVGDKCVYGESNA